MIKLTDSDLNKVITHSFKSAEMRLSAFELSGKPGLIRLRLLSLTTKREIKKKQKNCRVTSSVHAHPFGKEEEKKEKEKLTQAYDGEKRAREKLGRRRGKRKDK